MPRVGATPVEVLRLPGFSLDDLPPEPPEHEQAGPHQSRLGRSLAAIIPGEVGPEPRRRGGVASIIPVGPRDATPVAPAALPDAARCLLDRLHGDLVVALLDGLVAAAPTDLVAYVHQPDRGSPALHLGRPARADLDPARAYHAFLGLDALGRSRPGRVQRFEAGGYRGVGLVIAGTGCRGTWVVARQDAALPDRQADEAVAYVRRTGAGATLIDPSASGPPAVTPEVEVRIGEGQVQAEVAMPGGRGRAGAPTGVEAVARAALEAADDDGDFLYAASTRDGELAASVVLVQHGARVGVGCAAGALDAPLLTAAAARRAAGEGSTAGG